MNYNGARVSLTILYIAALGLSVPLYGSLGGLEVTTSYFLLLLWLHERCR
jgi:hypothetical protein